MTIDPGTYDVEPDLDDLRSVVAEQHEDARRDDAADYLQRGEYARALNPMVGLVTQLEHSLRAITEAVGLPAGAPPSTVEFRATADRELAEAAMVLYRTSGGPDDPEWLAALSSLMGACDRYRKVVAA